MRGHTNYAQDKRETFLLLNNKYGPFKNISKTMYTMKSPRSIRAWELHDLANDISE